MAYVLANNEILKASEANLTPFLFNSPDVYKYSIWFGFGGIPLFYENLPILTRELTTLGLGIPELLKNPRELFRLAKRLLNKNRFYRSGLLTFQFFCIKGKVDLLITCKAFEQFDFQINKHGLLMNSAKRRLCSNMPDAGSQFAKSYFWQQASAAIKNKTNALTVILNDKNAVCEGIASNLFMIKENRLYTPSARTACYADVLRPEIIRLANKLQLQVTEAEKLTLKNLLQMDEVFFVSETKGIQWALGYEERRFVNQNTHKIYNALNTFLKEKAKS